MLRTIAGSLRAARFLILALAALTALVAVAPAEAGHSRKSSHKHHKSHKGHTKRTRARAQTRRKRDTEAPTAPGNLAARPGNQQVTLTWTASTDNVGVKAYRIYRNGALAAIAAGWSTIYTDAPVPNGQPLTYTVKAYDKAGNLSPASNAVTVTPSDGTTSSGSGSSTGTTGSTGGGGGASTCTPTNMQTLTGSNVSGIQNNGYHVQSNEWGSSAAFAITNDGCPDFTITQSAINNSTSGAPGAYPSIYKGCHWGYCTSGSGLPVQESAVAAGGRVTTSADTTTVTSGAWDDAYDIWWNATSTTTSGGGLEMMIWLTKLGPVQPAGSKVASGVNIGGRSYDVWHNGSSPGGTVSYVMTSPVTSVSNLDLGQIAADATARGYMLSSWYLIGVEFGFEPWQGGAGLKVNSFDVTVH
jgi:cellulose 1,4-beta-cellobiosidase